MSYGGIACVGTEIKRDVEEPVKLDIVIEGSAIRVIQHWFAQNYDVTILLILLVTHMRSLHTSTDYLQVVSIFRLMIVVRR